MHKSVQLFELLGNSKCVKLWKFFLQNPSNEFSQTEVLKQTKLSRATAIKWLRVLVASEFLKMRAIGPAKLYQISSNPVNKLLKATATVAFLMPLAQISDAYLYGSAARGEDTETSDIDILVIGKITKQEVIKITEQLSRQINRPIKPVIMTPMEWAALKTKDPAFYERVEKDKIKLTWT